MDNDPITNDPNISSKDLGKDIIDFITQLKGVTFLTYREHLVVENWLKKAVDQDQLILVLAELLPQFFAEQNQKGKQGYLTSINRKVLKSIECSSNVF